MYNIIKRGAPTHYTHLWFLKHQTQGQIYWYTSLQSFGESFHKILEPGWEIFSHSATRASVRLGSNIER